MAEITQTSDSIIAKGAQPIQRTNFTGAIAIAETFTPTGPCEVLEVRIHLSAAGGAADFDIEIQSAVGSIYNTIWQSIDMTTVEDIWITDARLFLGSGDVLGFDWANASSRTVGIEVVWRAL